jgi:uncharacterized spore protein YtfJ
MSDDEKRAGNRPSTIAERIADRLGVNTGWRRVYGDPITSGHVTIIPVTSVRFAFGGGGGGMGGEGEGSEGGGGGGFCMIMPAGHIEIVDGRSRFVRAWDPAFAVAQFALASVAVYLIARLLRRSR